MQRVLEAVYAHRMRLLILLIVPPLVSLGIAFKLPRTYQSTATIWALQRYVVIGATGPEADLTATPAATQATTIDELMQARVFALAVANETDLPSTLSAATRADPQARDDALFQAISTQVQATGAGSNLVTISFQSTSPKIAQEVVAAVIDTYAKQSASFSTAEGQLLLQDYQNQLSSAKVNAAAATNTVQRYLNDHPSATAVTDPEFAQLQAHAQQALTVESNLENSIASLNQEMATVGTGANGLFIMLDKPSLPIHPLSRTKELALGGGVGVAVAVLACALYLLVLVRRDRSLRSPLDAQRVTSLPVLTQLPRISDSSMLLALEAPRRGKRQRDKQ